MDRRRLALFAALLLLAGLAAMPAGAARVPRRLLVAVEAKGDVYSSVEQLELSRSLLAAIQGSGTDVLLLDWGSEAFPADQPDRITQMQQRQADCWLWISVAGSRKEPALAVRAYDSLVSRNVYEGRIVPGQAFAFPNPPPETWKQVVEIVAARLPPLDSEQPLSSLRGSQPPMWSRDRVELTIRAAAGTILEGLDAGPMQVGEAGALVEKVRSPATYLLRATNPRYLPSELRLYLEDDREVTIPQTPLARFAVDAGLLGLSFPQVDASLFIVPGWLYAKAGIMSYLAGLAFRSDLMFWSKPMSTVSFQLGTYALLPPESAFRPYAGAGALLRVAHPLGSPPVYIDEAAPWAFQLAFGFELSPWPRSRFFLEWTPTEYMSRYPDLFRASLGSYVPDAFVFLPFAVIDPTLFRMGWRWML